MSKLIHTKFNQTNISPHINNYSTRGIIHDTRNISNDPTCRRVKKSFLALLAVLGSCSLSCGTLATVTGNVHAVGTEVDFNVTIPNTPVLEIILKDGAGSEITSETGMTVTPTMAYAGFNTTGVNVTVGTSSTAGYNLKMLIDNSSKVSENNLSGINTNALVSSEGNTIETLDVNPDTPFTCTTATATTCNFTVNSWGYRLSTDAENTYKAIPAAETELVNYTDGATNGITTSLDFGVRANAKQPGGDYSTTLNFIATANAEQLTIDSLTYMQDFAMLTGEEYVNVVDSMTTGTSYTLKDSRDREAYVISKLADGRIWMLDNLRLGSELPTVLTNADTNIEDDYYVLPASVAEGFTDDASGRTVARINTDSKNVELEYTDGKSNKVGTYYNYCAASAGQICMDSNSGTSATTDICPKGWRLPTGGGSGEFKSLYGQYNNYTTFKTAFHASLSGRFRDSSMGYQGSDGYWWSSTYYNSTYTYFLSLNTSAVDPEGVNSRRYGFSVRCVLNSSGIDTSITFSPNGADSGSATTLTLTSGSDSLPYDNFTKTGYRIASWNTAADGSGASYAVNTPVTVDMDGLTLYAQWTTGTWMQRLADNSCTTTAQTVYDVRDGNSYTVQRLNDGLCWMLDNLALDPSAQELNSSNTNVTSTVTTTFENKTSGWTGANGAWTSAFFNLASKDISVQYGNNSSNKTKVGGYYNYCAASAGTICASESNNNNASYDICPAGWKMPNGDTAKGSYYYLFNTGYSGNKDNFKNALHAGYSGNFLNSTVGGQGGLGGFWSATRYDGGNMYYLYVDGSNVHPQNYTGRYYGVSVRCVLKSPS